MNRLLPEFDVGEPAWSPDGTRVAFIKTSSQGTELAVVNADGTGRNRIVSPEGPGVGVSDPAWSPDGDYLALTRSTTNPYETQIYVVHSSGCCWRRVTSRFVDGVDGVSSFTPAWSPDGSKIAFTRTIGRSSGLDDEIYVVNADGTGLTNLTNFPETRFAMLTEFHPTWSPDGTRIAFSSFREDNFDIYVMNADGSDQTRITTHSGPDRDPAWSPDGTKIAFSSGRLLTPTGSSNNEIWSVSPDGSGETRLTSSVPANNFKPDWQRLNREPNCSGVAPTPGALWPPNRRFRTVTLSSAMDPDGDSVSASIDGVTQDERVGAQPDGRLSGDETVRLRAERDQRGDGRVYTIAFTATDDRGGSCSGTTSVEVRKHKHRPAVDSSPPSHDSLGP